MKNTVKKILALVFVVAMVCSLAVPAFATGAEETVPVTVTVVNYEGVSFVHEVSLPLKKANVEEAVKAFNVASDETNEFDAEYSASTGKITKVDGLRASEVKYTPNGGTETDANVFGTGYWAVALNGKLVSEDMSTVAVEEGDRVIVYWNDPTFETKLAQVDDSAIAQGILSFYYYDAEGNKLPFVGADVVISTNGEEHLAASEPTALVEDVLNENSTTFVTDEKGQIWIAPKYLDDDADLKVVSFDIKDLKPVTGEAAKAYKTAELIYRNHAANLARNLEAADVVGVATDVTGLYDVAGATGDMTIVYVMVAAAAVITLGAVVVIKKKAVKAN